ncbi:PREDICTED: probable serine/threonine-protein kinase DDB_G0282963 isoform X2 [Wasmannia auropunctata]|uniref:probable serine/threonine-protein kinase DDB_G0282963 isoform X2 n=1 Tax=Wasmannia auropunctata TaxID=64793 RepID=UPI0005ED8A92|nr:PREDICTED: probable serine/threonine-protein kinase DDB_G0282963 isoform X2 [Wasmannia auropunctata]XP_011686187.1 PREDICTED: probable serine/threonine-protein kinase DDB_G0282963 isoform X2 [Wasmannia auropunctata]
MNFRHSTEKLEEIGEPQRTMSYHRGGQAGAVAVSYSTSPMAPHSPSRRYSSGTSGGGTTTSALGGTTSKFSSYRSTGSSSILDRPTSFYTPSSSSGLRSNYIPSEYRRSYCAPGSFYTSASTGTSVRRNYSSEYSRATCSPARSVSSSSYGDTGGSSGAALATTIVNGTVSGSGGRYVSSTSSTSVTSSTSSSRERSSSTVDATADIISRYSPASYVPSIQRQQQQASGSGSAHHWRHRSTSSSLNELFGGDEREVERRDLRLESSLSSSSSSSSVAAGAAAGLWSKSGKRRPPTNSTVLTTVGGHARTDSSAVSLVEVTTTVDDHVTRKPNDDDDENDGTKDDDDDQHNNNSNVGNTGREGSGEDIACGYGVNNNDDERDNDDNDADGDGDENEDGDDANDDDDNLNNCHRRFHQQRRHRPDEVSPVKRNVLSPAAAAAAGGGSGLIGVSSLDLLTNLATNPHNTELLINNNAQDKVTSGQEEAEITTSNEVTRGADDVTSIVTFVQRDRVSDRDIPEDGELEENNVSNGTNESGFGGTIDNVAGRPSVTHGDDPSIPSTSRRTDQSGLFSSATGSNLTSSPTNPSTAHQNIYRGVNEQYEGSPTNRSSRSRLQALRDERCGLNGLRNIGNTCFMNSVIQCLSNTRPLLEYLLNEQHLADINTTTSSMKGALIKAFSQVIHELWEVGGDHVVNTTALKSQIQRFAPRFMGYSQQDAQEFLRYLLEGLHEDVNRVITKLPPIHGDIPDSYTDMQKAVESWKRYLRSEDSTIVDVFVGQLRSSLRCTSCDHVSVTLDPFWDLSLPIPARSGTVKLSQCLEHFTREEVLDGDEKPTCSKCQMRRKCTKSFSIQKFPKILVIHLKRFSPMERFRGKLNVMVDFPLTGLDLSAFAAPRVPGCTYNLYGVANHSGTTYSGHYTAYCKHPYSGEWHEYNDSRVSGVSARSVVSSEAYVLFYEQQPHSSHL